jgi:site-specific DNA-methyltransferase (adenine-specific)
MFIPLQDFTKSWTDHELYEKYNLTNFETDFIESSVWPDGNVMNGDNND